METYAECHFHEVEGHTLCNNCGENINAQTPWEHLDLHCTEVATWIAALPQKQIFVDYLGTARWQLGQATEHRHFWLRGVMPLADVDQLSLDYSFGTSFPTGERLCVHGCFLGRRW